MGICSGSLQTFFNDAASDIFETILTTAFLLKIQSTTCDQPNGMKRRVNGTLEHGT